MININYHLLTIEITSYLISIDDVNKIHKKIERLNFNYTKPFIKLLQDYSIARG